MKCSEFTRQLDARLAGDLASSRFPGRLGKAHLEHCDQCTDAWTSARGFLGACEAADDDVELAGIATIANRARRDLRVAFGRAGYPVVRFDWLRTPVGRVFVGVSDQGVCDVTFDESSEDGYRRRMATRASEMWRDRAAVETALTELDAYFSGQQRRFSLQIDLRGATAFTARVLRATRRIPFGSLLSYGEVAKRIGSPGASRAVGGALGRNPVPIIVPCHRVVAHGGKLGGFTGGVEVKRALLEIEGHAREQNLRR